MAAVSASAAEENAEEMDLETKSREAHQRASSDMMYQNEEWKALYYQNERVIQLLKQVRDSLEAIRMRDAVKNPEETKQ